MAQHISRKELKQDKIRESLEHGAEAVASHSRLISGLLVAAAIAVAIGGGWRIYSERRNVKAAAAFDEGMKVYNARIRALNEPAVPGELTYLDENTKLQEAAAKFSEAAEKYSGTDPGKMARYYAALCLEDLGKTNQALENLKKLQGTSDRELAALAKYQTAVIYARTGKTDEAVKIYRELAEKPTLFVPRSLVLLDLAGQLRKTNPTEAASIYQQIKKEFPDSAISEEADRGLESLPKT